MKGLYSYSTIRTVRILDITAKKIWVDHERRLSYSMIYPFRKTILIDYEGDEFRALKHLL